MAGVHMSLQSVGRVSQHCSISTVQYAAMKLYRCVFEIRKKVEFKHVCDPTHKRSVKGVGMIALHRRPTLFLICNLFHKSSGDPSSSSFGVSV